MPREHYTWCGTQWRAFIKHVGLSGKDGALSYSKCIMISIVVAYTASNLLVQRDPMPALVACFVIAFATSARVGLELIEKWRPTFTLSDSRTVTDTTTRSITEHRDHATGIDPS